MRSFAAGKIDVYFGPTELGAPDDLEQAIVDFVDGATSSLDIAVQEIDSLKIADANFVADSAYDEIKEQGRKAIAVDAARCRELAKYVKDELERIFNLSDKFQPG